MTTMRRRSTTTRRRLSAMAGLSIVELMVGITISLFILAGATLVLTTQLENNRRLLLEAQVQQDLRTAADMISRDVRGAGFWGQAYCNVWRPKDEDLAPCLAGNPYNRITPTGTTQLVYDRSTDSEGGTGFNREDGGLDLDANRSRERVGFRWNERNGTIDYRVGDNNWQALTDQAVLRVTEFNLTLNSVALPVPCAGADCQARGPQCDGPMTVRSRDVTVTIVAEAVHDASVRRSLRENIRLRNSVPEEECP